MLTFIILTRLSPGAVRSPESLQQLECWRAISLFKSIPNFFESGAGATIIQFSARGAGGPDRPDSLVCEFDDNAAAEEHHMRQLGKRCYRILAFGAFSERQSVILK